jgi:hypothetical protein
LSPATFFLSLFFPIENGGSVTNEKQHDIYLHSDPANIRDLMKDIPPKQRRKM